MPLLAQRFEDLVDHRLFAAPALGRVQSDVTRLAVGVAAMEYEGPGFYHLVRKMAIVSEPRIVRDSRSFFQRLWVDERITALCAEEVQLMVVPRTSGQRRILQSHIGFVRD